MNQLKVFTIKEASQLLPKIVPLIKELQTKRDTILKLEVEIDSMELVTPREKEGGSPAFNAKVEEYTKLVNRFYSVIDEIHETGCVLKDLDTGLIDFYSLYKGRVVYLCWKIEEPEIAFWHEIGSGYASRQPIIEHSEER